MSASPGRTLASPGDTPRDGGLDPDTDGGDPDRDDTDSADRGDPDRAGRAVVVEPGASRRAGSASRRASSTAAREQVIEEREHVANVVRMRWVLGIGTVLWFLTGALDLTVIRFIEPGPIAYFWLLRGAELIVLVACVARLSARPIPSARELLMIDLSVYVGASITVALMCLRYGGITSPYAHGVSCILVARGIAMPDRARRGAVLLGLPALAFPGALLAAVPFSPRIAAGLHDPASLAVFVQNVVLILVTATLLVTGGHAFWVLRRQVFEAREVGRYRLRKKLGEGGMGEVWRAYHPALRRDVAMKILRSSEATPAAIERFEREVRATSELTHPNTVRVYDCGVTDDGLWFYAMELLEGRTLADLVPRDRGLPPRRAVALLRQACRAIAEAHGRGIVHRDIKPENLFVTALGGERDFVKVLDFGIVKLGSDEGGTTLTGEGAVLGTPAYMSPEQARGRPADARSDVYALGAVLYFALAGRPPFVGPNAAAIIASQISDPPRPPSHYAVARVPRVLDAIVARCLAKDPAERYATAGELDDALSAGLMEDPARDAAPETQPDTAPELPTPDTVADPRAATTLDARPPAPAVRTLASAKDDDR